MSFAPWPAANGLKAFRRMCSAIPNRLFPPGRGCGKWPDKTFTSQRRRKTYRQVKDTADRIASLLAGQGSPRGTGAIFLPNLPPYPPPSNSPSSRPRGLVTATPCTRPRNSVPAQGRRSQGGLCMDQSAFLPPTSRRPGHGRQNRRGLRGQVLPFRRSRPFWEACWGKSPRPTRSTGPFDFRRCLGGNRPEPPDVPSRPDRPGPVSLTPAAPPACPRRGPNPHQLRLHWKPVAWVRVPQYQGWTAGKAV
jgi:hypothetical protein